MLNQLLSRLNLVIQNNKEQIIQRNLNTLNDNEREQFAAFIRRYWPNETEAYIDEKTRSGPNYDIVLIKDKDKVLAISSLKIIRMQTPFSKKTIPVIQFGLYLKSEDYRGNSALKMSIWYAQKHLGYLFSLKKIVGISTICSPKAFENFTNMFAENYPFAFPKNNPKNISFINTFLQVHRKFNIVVDDSYCFEHTIKEKIEITSDWDRFYKAKNPAINDFFVQKGIIEFRNNRIFRTPTTIVALGYRNPLKIF